MTTKTANSRKGERVFLAVLWAVLEVFTLVSLIAMAIKGNAMKSLMCALTMLLLALPYIAERLFKCRLNTVFFAFCEVYALGPMIGYVYNMYYLTEWWDDVLHTSGGVVFAIFGIYIAKLASKGNEPTFLMKAIFALCFSMAISVAWEFFEYGCDQFLGTDMQNDTVVTYINSYVLGEQMAVTGRIDNITEVIVNGVPLSLGGYLDIGLHDTMHDMLVESLGALIYVVIYAFDKEKHPIIMPNKAQISQKRELNEKA